MQFDMNYTLDILKGLLAIDSPTGFCREVGIWAKEQFEALGIPAEIRQKGGVLADLGALCKTENDDNAILLSAHIDTLGAMVAEVKGSGRLRVKNVGGLSPSNTETEFVKVYTRDGKVIDGTLQLCDASAHVNSGVNSSVRTWDNVEVLLDEVVSSAADVKALGIENGCYVCVSPRTVITGSGYIKSRYLDDKLSAAILLGFAKYLVDNGIKTDRHI